jgi:predicted site-specific integrase-resolvase
MDEKYLTGKQARDAMGVTKKTLLKYLREGLIPGAYRLPSTQSQPGAWRIPVSGIEKFRAAGMS